MLSLILDFIVDVRVCITAITIIQFKFIKLASMSANACCYASPSACLLSRLRSCSLKLNNVSVTKSHWYFLLTKL